MNGFCLDDSCTRVYPLASSPRFYSISIRFETVYPSRHDSDSALRSLTLAPRMLRAVCLAQQPMAAPAPRRRAFHDPHGPFRRPHRSHSSFADLQAMPQTSVNVLNSHSKQNETYSGPARLRRPRQSGHRALASRPSTPSFTPTSLQPAQTATSSSSPAPSSSPDCTRPRRSSPSRNQAAAHAYRRVPTHRLRRRKARALGAQPRQPSVVPRHCCRTLRPQRQPAAHHPEAAHESRHTPHEIVLRRCRLHHRPGPLCAINRRPQIACQRQVKALADPNPVALTPQQDVALVARVHALIRISSHRSPAASARHTAAAAALRTHGRSSSAESGFFQRDSYSNANDAVVSFSAAVAFLRCAA